MRRYIYGINLVLLLAGQACSWAQSSVDIAAPVSQKDVFYNGTVVPNGNYVKVGFFNNGFDPIANGGNFSALQAAWRELGFIPIKPVMGSPGRFGDTLFTFDSLFDGKRLSLWIFQTANNGAPTASFDNVTAYGLFSSTLPDWIFPPQGSVPPNNSTTVTSSQVNQAFWGSFDASHLLLSPVPEPSTYLLVALGLAPFVWLRIRKHRR